MVKVSDVVYYATHPNELKAIAQWSVRIFLHPAAH